MQKPKVNVLIALFAYSGNGGIASTIPEIAVWLAETAVMLHKDPRVEKAVSMVLCDTPITMTRNRAIEVAKAGGFDMILMLDSDNEPDGYYGKDPNAKRFMDVAFTFAYDRLVQGTPTVIAAPYCGPPPHPLGESEGEVPYLFEWMNDSSNEERPGFRLHRMNRNEAARLTGICPVAALPTGVCLFTLNAFEGMSHPYFSYEFDATHSEKKSTEDVYATRNISLFWQNRIGQDVVFAACDSWALHHKVKKVGRPTLLSTEAVHKDLRDRFLESAGVKEEQLMDLDFTDGKTVLSEINETAPQPKESARVIGRRTIKTYVNMTPENDLKELAEVVAQLGQKLKRDTVGVEVGSWVGESAAAILHGQEKSGFGGILYCVDTWEGNPNDYLGQVVEEAGSEHILSLFLENMDRDIKTERVRAIKGHSVDVANNLLQSQEQVDFVFIDAGHSYEEVKADILAWAPLLPPHGLLIGHDYCPQFPGVMQAVDELCGPGTHVPGTNLWVAKRAESDGANS